MDETRRVTLELLRKGPAHNQLLSPLTEYLCLCGNFGATTINVPWEHAQFLSKVREMYYPYNDQAIEESEYLHKRQEAIGELAKEIAVLLGSVPGLAHGINGSSKSDVQTLTHLRLVISAAELAMLPFELSKNIAGIPGGRENWLSLQTTSPVCITRQVRSVTHRLIKWPERPKVLFIAASPSGKIPLKGHLQAMVGAVDPWVMTLKPADKNDRLKKTGEVLTVLPDADIEKIANACRKESYTHIHILAHGAEDPKTSGNPFGIALHDINDPSKVDVVTGTRLAAAICPLKDDNPGPAVITVASCNSGSTSSVIYNTGASFAHDLHKNGIPLIIASQYPLTFAGSIMLVEEIYGNLLWGAEPLKVIHNLRTKLYALKSSDNHDWASLVVYECLDDKLKDAMMDTTYVQVKAAIDNVLRQADAIIRSGTDNEKGTENERPDEESIEQMFSYIDVFTKKYPDSEVYEVEILGLRGTVEKRKAELYYKIGSVNKSYAALMKARRLYADAMDRSLQTRTKFRSSSHWLITQYLSLCAVLCCQDDMGYWHSAKKAAETDIRISESEVIWGHSSLAELYLLSLAYPESFQIETVTKDKASVMALEHIKKVRELSKADAFQIQSTRRQLRRYLDWWCKDDFQENVHKKACNNSPGRFNELIKCAKEMSEILEGRC